VVGRCWAGGEHASPRAGHAVALKAKLHPRCQLWEGVCWLQGRCWAGAPVLGGWRGRWKELIGFSLQSTGGHTQSCALWVFALLAQLPTICFCAARWLSGAYWESDGLSLLLAQFALQNDRDFSFPFCKRGVFSALPLFCLVCPMNEMLTLLTSVSAKCMEANRSWRKKCC